MIYLPGFGLSSPNWSEASRGDSFARKMADRHYSRRTPGSPDFLGPCVGFLVLVGDGRLWASVVNRYRQDGLYGIHCTIYRNESAVLSSTLIKEACELSWQRFGQHLPIFTFVDQRQVRSSNPGFCFKMAGFRVIGRTVGRKLIVLKLDATVIAKEQAA